MMAAAVLVPPAVAMLIGRARLLRPVPATGIALLAVAVAAGLAWAAPAYTIERPQWRAARYVHDMAAGVAFWEVAGVEPGLDLAPRGSDATTGTAEGWELARDEPPASVRVGRLPHPFVFRRLDPRGEPPPAEAWMTFDAGSRQLTVRVTPAETGLWAGIVLPDGGPLDASLPGRSGIEGWSARFAGVPAEGLVFTATLERATSPPVRVVVGHAGLPGGADVPRRSEGAAGSRPVDGRLPAWLPADRVAWEATSVWILAPRSELR